MATTLVGLFDSLPEAENARAMLLREGIESGAVHLTNNESLTATTTTVDSDEHRGFFARLFGLGDNDNTADSYGQALKKGAAMLTVTLPDGADSSRVESMLEKAGAVDVNERGATHGTSASSERVRDERLTEKRTAGDTGNQTLKVVQEELHVGKRAVESGGVRVRQYTTERPVQEQVKLCEERAIVERRPVDRVLGAGEIDSLDLRDREFEVHERSEVPVVQKQARVVEEVAVGKQANVRTETIEDSVRRTDVDVEQLTAAQQNTQRQDGNSLRNPTQR